jgi:succinyl-CoA synthetase beta subunit
VVVKAQIHAGGRGKGGGVKIAKSVQEAGDLAAKMLGMTLITHQTGPEGRVVRRLLIEETLPIEKELYLGILVDRAEGKPVFMASAAGGMDIEQVAANTPEKILKQHIDPGMVWSHFRRAKLPSRLASSRSRSTLPSSSLLACTVPFSRPMLRWSKSIRSSSAPTVGCSRSTPSSISTTTPSSAILIFASCATLRKKIRWKVEASKYSLNYIKLDGNVGCMVNGAGLAMATMDIIKYAGGMPANFLDVGGGANAEQVTHAFEILLSDKNVKAVLINIFGGILRVDTLATGVVEAANKTHIQLPIVLRLEGTNVEAGREILKQSALNFTGCRNDERRSREGCRRRREDS